MYLSTLPANFLSAQQKAACQNRPGDRKMN
jgi:hypothetical protein